MLKKLFAALLALCAAAALAAGVDINKASQAELEALKGIGPSAATKILAERQKGSFKDWGDVMQRVGGIKQAKAAKLSEAGLTVNGEGFKGAPAAKGDKPAKEKKTAKTEAKSEPTLAKMK
ncbi:MAG TPA: DUF655 domain-containing protein [Albitalea sp.]|uniref:ComEA family DNA-binding protein n=1 Tax=Piscinibacter sp. TaxID=1903157 RepID=UPI002ED0D451